MMNLLRYTNDVTPFMVKGFFNAFDEHEINQGSYSFDMDHMVETYLNVLSSKDLKAILIKYPYLVDGSHNKNSFLKNLNADDRKEILGRYPDIVKYTSYNKHVMHNTSSKDFKKILDRHPDADDSYSSDVYQKYLNDLDPEEITKILSEKPGIVHSSHEWKYLKKLSFEQFVEVASHDLDVYRYMDDYDEDLTATELFTKMTPKQATRFLMNGHSDVLYELTHDYTKSNNIDPQLLFDKLSPTQLEKVLLQDEKFLYYMDIDDVKESTMVRMVDRNPYFIKTLIHQDKVSEELLFKLEQTAVNSKKDVNNNAKDWIRPESKNKLGI